VIGVVSRHPEFGSTGNGAIELMTLRPAWDEQMVGQWSSLRFSDLADRLSSARLWLRGFGVEVQGARLGAYRKAMDDLVMAVASKDRDRLRALFPIVANDLFEANEIATIYAAYADGRHDDFVRERLKALAGGPLRYVEEDAHSSSNLPRNLAFELLVGARLIASGIQLEAAAGADVAALVGYQRLIFECKRPQTEKRVERRVVEARNQLRERCQPHLSPLTVGVIAVDVTKLTNPDFSLLYGVTSAEGTRMLSAYLKGFYEERQRLWARAASRKIVALFLRVSILARFSDDTGLTYCQQYLLVGLSTARPLARQTLGTLSAALGAGAEHDASI
jgi:hypothetical protein